MPSKRSKRGMKPPASPLEEASPRSDRAASSPSPDAKSDGKATVTEQRKDRAKRKKRKGAAGKATSDDGRKEASALPQKEQVEAEVRETPRLGGSQQFKNEESCKTSFTLREDRLVPGLEEPTEDKEERKSSALSTGTRQHGMPSRADLAAVFADSASESCSRDQGSTAVADEPCRRDDSVEQRAHTAETSSQRGLSTGGDMEHVFAESPWVAVAHGNAKPDSDGRQKASTSTLEMSSQRGWSTGADMGHIFAESPWVIVPEQERKEASATTTRLSSERGLSTGADMGHVFRKCPWIVDPEERSRLRAQGRSAQREERSHQTSYHGPVLLKGMDDLQINRPLRVRVVRFLSLVAVVLIVFAVAFIAIYYKSGSALPMSLQKFCTEDECHRATSYLTSAINKSIDACSDFYQRVCYRWISGKGGVGFVDGAVVSYYESIAKDVLASNATEIGRLGSHVFGAVFKSCSRLLRSERTAAELVARVKERLNDSLPTLRSSWKDAMRLVVKLTVKHGVGTVLDIGLEKVGTNRYLRLSAQKTLRERLGAATDVDERYEKYIGEATASLVPNITERISKRVLALDAAVANATLNGSSAVEEVHFAINITGRLSEGLTSEFWTRTINTYLPQKITFADGVLTSGFDAIRRMLSTLKAAQPRVANAYLNLLVAAEVLRYDYLRRRPDKRSDLTNICLQATQKVLTQTWPHVVSAISRHQYKVHYLGDIFKQMQEAVGEEIRFSKWMDVATRLAIRHRLARSTLYSFSEDELPNTVDYRALKLDGDDFVTDYFTALAYDAQVTLRSAAAIKRAVLLNELQLSGSAYFDGDSLVFPLPYATAPVFYLVNGEQFHNFATVGVIMAELLAKAASSPQYVRRLESGSYLGSLSSATECYRRQFETSFLDSRLPKELGNSVFAATVSVRAAYEKLRKYCRSNLSSREFQVYWTRIQQLFFERYCLLTCGDGGERILSPLQRCTIPLLNMAEFTAAYGCQNGTRMNRAAECEPL